MADAPFDPNAAPPSEIADLADSCVRFVERATGVKLDGTAETLPILDHYLRQAVEASSERDEARALVILSAGAYFGELVRKRFASWWRLEDGIEVARLEFRDMFLAFSPMEMVRQAIEPHDEVTATEAGDSAFFELDDADRPDVEARLAELPPVRAEEYYAPSTRLEVLDIAADAIRARRVTEGEPDLALERDDYDD